MRLALSFLCCLLLAASDATIRSTDKQASAYCYYISSEENALQVHFSVKLNTDPVGRLIALSNTAYNQNPKVYTAVTCSIDYDSVNRVYSVSSKRDRMTSDNINRDSNLCGMTEISLLGNKVYELLFFHQIMTNNFNMIDDKDRVYIVRCTESNTMSNMVTTSVGVQTPNLPVTVQIASLPVTLSLWLKNTATGSYSLVTENQVVSAGSTVRLQLELDRGTNYVPNVHVYGIYTYMTEAGATSFFSNMDYLVDNNGCRYGSSVNAAPYLPTQGFKGSVQSVAGGTKYVLVTGDFTMWKYDNSDRIFFRTYFDVCFADNTSPCTNLCKERTGNEARRKRQAAEEEELGIAITSIRVTTVIEDESDQTNIENPKADAATTSNILIVLAAVLGVLVITLIAVVVCTVAALRRRNAQRKRHNRFENMSVASTVSTSVPKN